MTRTVTMVQKFKFIPFSQRDAMGNEIKKEPFSLRLHPSTWVQLRQISTDNKNAKKGAKSLNQILDDAAQIYLIVIDLLKQHKLEPENLPLFIQGELQEHLSRKHFS